MNKRGRKQKKNRIIKTIISSLLVITIITAAALALIKPQTRFIIADTASKIGKKEALVSANTSDYNLVSYSMDELKENDSITFDQSLMLINTDNMLDESFSADASEYNDSGVVMNDCIKESYKQLKEAVYSECEKELLVTSAYRDASQQEAIKSEEGDIAQEVGASEHQSGLALDLCIQNYGGEAFLKSDAGQFVNSKCDDYGFIIRYPYYGKTETGIAYEPWHIRYVGAPHAKIISGSSITFEEYIKSLKENEFYEYDGYLISRQNDDTLKLPDSFKSAVISPDNTGCYIVTVLL